MPACPFCGGRMENLPLTYQLSKRQKLIFNEVIQGSRNGVEQEHLKLKFFKRNRSDVTLRTAMCAINKKIKPLFIESYEKVYRLRETGE